MSLLSAWSISLGSTFNRVIKKDYTVKYKNYTVKYQKNYTVKLSILRR
jgi:hypothetical protein